MATSAAPIAATALEASLWTAAGMPSATDASSEENERLPPHVALRALCALERITGCSGACGIEVEHLQDRYAEIVRDRRQLRRLLAEPGIVQRTDAWYRARHTLITASDIAQALGCAKFGTQREFFEKKVRPADAAAGGGFGELVMKCPPLKWGTMFEDVAAALYERRNGIRIHAFGLLVHPDAHVHVGASPDGITDAGVMVEIKCPYRRRINGEVPLQYYYQIQGQLEVCGLRHCDYLECEFSEYRTLDDFEYDTLYDPDDVRRQRAEAAGARMDDADADADAVGYGVACNGREKGALAEYVSEADAKVWYAYGPISPSRRELREWTEALHRDASTLGHLRKIHYWRLEKYSVQRVQRDAATVETMLAQLNDVWERVLTFREDPQAYDKWLAGQASPSSASAKPDAGGSHARVTQRAPPPTSSSSSSAALPLGRRAQQGEGMNFATGYAFVDDDED